MSKTYHFPDLLLFIEDDVLLEELINGAEFEKVNPSSFAISNVLNYSKALSISGSEYCNKVEIILN